MTYLSSAIFQWIDLLWVPAGMLIVERGKKIKTAIFVLACVMMLRLQVELLQQIGFPQGIVGLMDMDVLRRGQITYGVFIGFFLLLAFFSKGEDNHVYLAATLGMLILGFCVSSIVMVL